jgi:PAS domain S-box-containing protein
MTVTRSSAALTNLLSRLPWRGQEVRFQHLVEQIKEAVWVVMPRTGQFLAINGRATAVTGWTREELLTLSLAEIITSPDSLAHFYALEPGNVRYLQAVPVRAHQGQAVLVDMRLSAIEEGGDTLVLVLAAPSEDRLAQERERVTQAHILAHLDQLLPLFESPVADTLHEAVAIARDILGADAAGLYFSQSDTLGLQLKYADGISERFPHHIGPSEASHLKALYVWSSTQRGEGFLAQAFRSAGWTSVSAHPLGEPPNVAGSLFVAFRAGNPPSAKMPIFIGVVARQLTQLIAQITRQSRLTDAQRLALLLTDQLSALNARVTEGVITVDAKGSVDDLNPAAGQMLGYRSEDVIGLPVADVVSAAEPFVAALNDALERGAAHEQESRLHRRSGEAFPARIHIQPLPEPSRGAVIVLSDLSQARADEVRREHLDHLAYVGESSQAFAHEIRAPLNNIAMGVQYLAARFPTDDPLQPQLAKIQSETTRLSNLMNDMLAWAKPIDPKPEPTDLGALLRRLLVRWSAKLQQRNVQPSYTEAPHCPRILADARWIERVFVNLIENALQAMPAGGHLAVALSAAARSAQETVVEARVSDSGPGIAEEHRKRIFDPYFTTRPDGTGLGLAICKRIVTLHHGAISVESFPGTGTIFTVTLPAAPLEKPL